MRRGIFLTFFLIPALVAACEWDTDTLAEEASLGKDFISTIVGRFPRNPPRYYEMRRDRILAKRVKSPEEYDDVAVAYDKLGDPLSATKWIDKKPHGDATVEYRTHANRGTFLVHAFLKGKLDKAAAERGLQELETAVKINPEAHFGRERVQIKMVEEILHPDDSFEPDEDPIKAAEGFAGIIRLGSGWESPDVFRAMAEDLAAYRDKRPALGAVSTLALMRADELEKSGHKARFDKERFQFVEGSQTPALRTQTEEEFVRLRAEADAWAARRTAFMEERLKAGRHPDTDPTFWNGWVDGPKPEIRSNWISDNYGVLVPWWALVLGGLLTFSCVAGPLAALFFLVRASVRWFKLRKS